jgi:hypothetical protein
VSDLKKLLMIGMDSMQEVKIDKKYLFVFQQELARILLEKGWRKISNSVLMITEKGLKSVNYLDFTGMNVLDFGNEEDKVYILTFQKSMYEFLEVRCTIEEEKVLISWNRKISPSIGKNISIITALLLIISAIIRLLTPMDSMIAMAIFIIGIAGNLVFLLILIYLYDKSLERNTDEKVSFLESMIFVTDINRLATKL